MAENEWSGCGTTNTTPSSCVEIKADVIRYVNKVDTDSGWVQAKQGNSVETVSLHKYTKIMLLGTKDGRTYFKVLEGTQSGKTLHMKQENADEYLGKIAPKLEAATLIVNYGKFDRNWPSKARNIEFEQQLATGTAGGLKLDLTMNSIWNDVFFPLPPGEYLIRLPDTPHRKDMTAFYKNVEPSLSHHQVWFPIAFGDGSRYVHVGNVSDGCATVLTLKNWADLHEYLISHRRPDGNGVGKLILKGKPERER